MRLSLARPWPPRCFFFAQHLLALLAQMPGQLLEDAIEQAVERLVQAMTEDAVLLGFLLRVAHHFGEFLVLRDVALVVPFADRDQMILEPRDRVAERPGGGLARRAILGR